MSILNQWLEELYQELQGISEDDRQDIVKSYEEQINEMIELNVNEHEILSKLGSPKKVAQEIKQSFTDTETISEPENQVVFNVGEKTSDDVIKKGLLIFVFIITLFISLFFFITALRLIIGGSLLFQLSFGLMFAVLGLGVVFLNLGIATFYIGYLGYKRISERLN
ncbi:MAG: DUF1700 domain-containing protein [Turicibacter sp.]|nr:DUF1700 domain-containing protein [Turicibacter sp.]